ncbi:MAG TPA: gamma-glutamyltransferase [Acidobacteriaceae bacterium]|nr:gamma-glutamyltransferase [Acidobacteriaceae bacterium]
MSRFSALMFSALLCVAPFAHAQADEPVRTQHAMVVSIHHLATDAGVEIMREGGNAIDAAVATGFALAVVDPAAGNLGGGGFMLIHFSAGANAGKNTFLDFRERAPQAAAANMYLDANGNVIPNASINGFKAIGVPGSVAGLVYAEQKYGKLTLAQVMAPAIRFASDGYVLSTGEAKALHADNLSQFPVSRHKFQRDGNYYQPGEFFRQPLLAATLRAIAADPSSFYHGAIAKKLAADVQAGGGLITVDDLARYSVKKRAPVTGTYRDFTIVSAPPPSSGGITLIEALNILEGYNLSRWPDRSPEEIHLILEALRRAFMDRNDYLGDPDYVAIPVAQLISKSYAAAWRNSILQDQATPSSDLRRPAGFLPQPPTMEQVRHESTQTTHYSVIDPKGNAVAVTYTLNNLFGSGVTAAGLGFVLNDEMDDFASKQGVPNMFGLIQGPANSIAPGKRPLSSMAPTIVLQNDPGNDPKKAKVRFVLGSPGGSRIITTVANILLSAVDEGQNIQQAVDAPRFHLQFLPDVVYLEPGFPDSTINRLRSMGYNVQVQGHWSDGECIAVDPSTGELLGGHDHRQNFGKAAGY